MRPYWKRRLARHALLGVASAAVTVAGVALLHRTDLIWKISVTTGWIAVVLLAVTLVLGPLKVLRRRANPVTFDLRRDVGIWTAVMAIVHTGFGLFVHMRGRPWLYFIWEHPSAHLLPVRWDAFGVANWAGVLASGIVLTLGAVSNDVALRILGTARWKTFQRLNYVLFGLVVIHAAFYQLRLEHRPVWAILLLAAIIGFAVGLQLAGVHGVRRERRNRAV